MKGRALNLFADLGETPGEGEAVLDGRCQGFFSMISTKSVQNLIYHSNWVSIQPLVEAMIKRYSSAGDPLCLKEALIKLTVALNTSESE